MPALDLRERRAAKPETAAAVAVRVLGQARTRISRRAWSGGTGKHGGPQTGSVQVLNEPPADLPPARPVGRGEGRRTLMLLHTAAAPASLMLRGEWLRRFTSDAAALAWAEREGWTVEAPCR
jgi:hypothetical protein